MHRRTSPKVFAQSRELRHNQTEAENKLWQILRSHRLEDVHFRRQYAIGHYIVDFCSPRHKIVMEVDGGQHLEQQAYDNERTAFLEAKGYRIIRFWNNDITKDGESVIKVILEMIH